MNLDAFIQEWTGRQCCNGGLCECVALVNQWCDENGWPKPQGGSAASLVFPPPWQRLAVSPPQPGDVLIWASSLPGSGGEGHTAILVGGNPPGQFTVFAQNSDGQLSLPRLDTDYAPQYLLAAYHYPTNWLMALTDAEQAELLQKVRDLWHVHVVDGHPESTPESWANDRIGGVNAPGPRHQ